MTHDQEPILTAPTIPMKTLMFAFLLILALPLALAACSAADPHEEGTLDEEAQFSETTGDVLILQEGQRAVLPSLDAALTFVEKTQDSRCPANVVCIWEGEATISLEVTRSGQTPVSFEMAGFVGPDGDEGGSPITHDAFGLRFTLLRLNPYPLADVEQTDPVTVTIRVEVL